MIRGSDSTRVYFTFDAAGRVTKEAWRTSGGSNIYGFTYQYDDAGNRNRKTNLAGVHTYWDYDIADQATIQKNDADTRVYFTYDSSGHLAVEHDVDASAGRTYYTYDPRCLLTLIDFPGSTATNYFYWNALRERIRKDDSTGGKTYTWDGRNVILERDLTGSVTQRIVIGHDVAVFQQVGSSCIWPHKNLAGSTVRHTDGAQTIVNYYECDVWGQPLETTQGTAQQYRYKGAEVDPDAIAFNSNNARYNFNGKGYVPFRGNVLQGSACCADGGNGPSSDSPPPHDLPFGPIDSFGPPPMGRTGAGMRGREWPQPRPVDIGIGGSAGGDGGTTTGGNGSGGGFGGPSPAPDPGPFAGPSPFVGPSILVPYDGPRPGSERKVWCQKIYDIPSSDPGWGVSQPARPWWELERAALIKEGKYRYMGTPWWFLDTWLGKWLFGASATELYLAQQYNKNIKFITTWTVVDRPPKPPGEGWVPVYGGNGRIIGWEYEPTSSKILRFLLFEAPLCFVCPGGGFGTFIEGFGALGARAVVQKGLFGLFGHNEWRIAASREAEALRWLRELEARYIRETGLRIKVVPYDAPPIGGRVGALGEFFPQTKEIVLYSGEKYGLGARAEELLHYFQIKGRGLLGKKVSQRITQLVEDEVEILLRSIGFEPIR